MSEIAREIIAGMSADSFDFWLGTWDVSWDDSSDRMTLERVSGSAEA